MFGSPDSIHANASFWLDVVDKAIKAVAVLIGGVWTYVNIRISRIYRHKAEVSITGTLHPRGNALLLIIDCRIKNIGQVKYDINQRGTCIQVFGIDDQGNDEQIALLEVFKEHFWVEPGELVTEPKSLLIPTCYLAIKTTMRVVSAKIEWNASSITTIDNPTENTAWQGKEIMIAHDQMPESLRKTESIERQKEHQRDRERVQKPEDTHKTDKIEREKKKTWVSHAHYAYSDLGRPPRWFESRFTPRLSGGDVALRELEFPTEDAA